MADENCTHSKRVKLSVDDAQALSKEELLEKWQEQEAYIEALLTKYRPAEENELANLRESEEKLKQQQVESTRRENVLVMRLTAKEQEMAEYMNQMQEMKQNQTTNATQLRTMLLDPAINIMFQRMKKEMDANKEKLEQAQNDLAAWKFTPDSQTGKRLMAKCRMLLQENEELGKVISSGRTAKLEGEIALEKTLVQEMKKSQAEMDEFLLELDEDVEGMQSTIYLLQQQLKESKEQIIQLQEENENLRGQFTKAKPDFGLRDEQDSIRSSPTNQTDELMEKSKDRTRNDEIPISGRTSRQSNHSPCEQHVLNHKREHQFGSKQDHIKTTKPSNGGHEHESMETDDVQQQSCDGDKNSSSSPTNHRQFSSVSSSETTCDTTNSKGGSACTDGQEVTNHQNNITTSDRDTISDADFVITENTDATSSDGSWSGQTRDVDMDAEPGFQTGDAELRTEMKGRTVRGLATGKDNNQLHNGTLYQSRDDENMV